MPGQQRFALWALENPRWKTNPHPTPTLRARGLGAREGSGLTPTRGPPHLPLVREGRPLLLSGTLSQGPAQPVSQGIAVLGAPHAGSPAQPRRALWRLFPQGAEASSSLIPTPRPRTLDSPAVCSAGSPGEPISGTAGEAGGGESRASQGRAHAQYGHRGHAQ